jgi:hypothetical protein
MALPHAYYEQRFGAAGMEVEELAKGVLLRAILRCGPYYSEPIMGPVKDEEAQKAYCYLLMPLAMKLKNLQFSGAADAFKIREQALHWMGLLIEDIFTDSLQVGKNERRASDLINIAHDLCQVLDRIPTKKEVFGEAKKRNKKEFDRGSNMETKLLSLAGLGTLPTAPPPGRPRR